MAMPYKVTHVSHPRLKKVSAEVIFYKDGSVKRVLHAPKGYRGPEELPPYEGRQSGALKDTLDLLSKIKGPARAGVGNSKSQSKRRGISSAAQRGLEEIRRLTGARCLP